MSQVVVYSSDYCPFCIRAKQLLQSKKVAFDEIKYLDPADYAAHGGAFPITIKNVGMIGTVTVSGLRQAEDHAIAVEALRAVLA